MDGMGMVPKDHHRHGQPGIPIHKEKGDDLLDMGSSQPGSTTNSQRERHNWVKDQFKLDDNLFLHNKPELKEELTEMLRRHGNALTGVGGSFKAEPTG